MCLCDAYKYNVYAVVQNFNCTPHRPLPHHKQNKKTHYPVRVTYQYSDIQGRQKMFYGFLRVNRTPPPSTPRKKKSLPTYPNTATYFKIITLDFRIGSKPLWLPTKDLVFFRFIILMYHPHIKTFNKIKTFSDLPYLNYPCNSKHISWPHHSVQIFETIDSCISKLPISTKFRYLHLSPNPNFHVVCIITSTLL